MEHYLPEIFWHDRKGLLSVDFQKSPGTKNESYKIVTTSMQKEVRIWELLFEKVQGERDALAVNFVANIIGHQYAVNAARFSPDGTLLASADSGGTVFVWKYSSGTPPATNPDPDIDDFPQNKENWTRLRAPLRHDSDVIAVCWSIDGLYLASVSNDESIVVQNVRTGNRVWSINNYRSFPNGVVWDPRGKYIVTMSTDRKLDILDAAKGTRLKCFHTVDFCDKRISNTLILKGVRFVVHKLFHDDQLISFMRGADFSPDGELLIAPCGHLEIDDCNVYGTYVFCRRDFDKDCPAAFLRSRKPTFRAVCSPVVFELRDDVQENVLGLPYRVIWTVLTLDAITVYDSQASLPFSYLDGIHYNNLSDAAWSPDGRILLVSSLEGYCSIIRFDLNCIGKLTQYSPNNLPPSPVLTGSRKPKRSGEVASVGKRQGAPAKGTVNDSPQRKSTAKLRPKTPVNLISKYFKKSPLNVTDSQDGTASRTHGNENENIVKVSNSTPSESKKQKRRVQLETIPFIEID